MRKRKHLGFCSQKACHRGRQHSETLLCCFSSVLNARRRKSSPTRWQAVDVPLVLTITVWRLFFLLPYLRLTGHSAMPSEHRPIVDPQLLFFVFRMHLREGRPEEDPVAELRHCDGNSAPRRKTEVSGFFGTDPKLPNRKFRRTKLSILLIRSTPQRNLTYKWPTSKK